MKRFVIILFMLTAHFCFAQKYQIDINQSWQFKQAGKTEWLPATVPGTVHTDLFTNKKIADPFYGTNEKDLQWIDKVSWEYKTDFTIDDSIFKNQNILIDFKGLDTYADVYLNNVKILSAANMFREWKVDIKKIVKNGTNNLRIFFHSPITKGLELLEQNCYPLPADNDQSETGGMGDTKVSIFTRKAPYHFGWDWGPRLVTSGIWRPVYIVAWNDISFSDLYVVQNQISKSVAKLIANVQLKSNLEKDITIKILVNDKLTKTEILKLKSGNNKSSIDFEIKNPQLWWTNGLGEAYLYEVKCLAFIDNKLVDKIDVKTGLRTVELIQADDAKGKSFYFNVNGKPVFAKGADYIPNDVFLPRVSVDDYEKVVQSAYLANMNMLRVWGGGIYENDIFYNLCDKYGIMVWQDFMFACAMYPGDSSFINNVKEEVNDNLIRLRNHPCIVLWCGNNEIDQAWAEYKENRGWGWKQRYTQTIHKEIWANYEKLFHELLPQKVKELTGNGIYWYSSPSAGFKQIAGDESTSGDMHYWGVWHGNQPFENYYKYIGRFMSEYGFQSFPEMQTVKQYAAKDQWDINSTVMSAHQRSGIGNMRIKEYLSKRYKEPKDFESFLYISQLMQAEALKMAFYAHRTAMPYCMGSLYWQINDCWQVASWSGMDYYKHWKALHYFAKKAFEPVIIAPQVLQDTLKIFVVSEKLTNLSANIKLDLMDFDGKSLWKKDLPVTIKTNTSQLCVFVPVANLLKGFDKTKVFLQTSLNVKDKTIATDEVFFTQPKDLNLPKAVIRKEISKTDNGYLVSLISKTIARNVCLSLDDMNVSFSDNYFNLLPSKTYQIKVKTNLSLTDVEQKLKIVSLTDSY